MTTTKLRWARIFPSSGNNFDLVATNPQEFDPVMMNELLGSVLGETHRGLTLSSVASKEFERWFAQPETPLKSAAYVLLSNWFMTRSGDRRSMVANRCEVLWDALFPCRPLGRLSSPEPGRNHVILPAEFERFWQNVLNMQGRDISHDGRTSATPNVNAPTTDSERLRALVDNKKGLHCEVEGSPRAIADFLKFVSGWEDRHNLDEQV